MKKEEIIRSVKRFDIHYYGYEIRKKIKTVIDILDRLHVGAKIINVTVIHHNDLDGYGVKMIWMYFEKLYPNLTVTYVMEKVRVEKETLMNIIEEDNFDYIVIGDLSLSDECLDNKLIKNNTDKMVMLDHHTSAVKFNVYDFAFVAPHNTKSGELTSGSKLMLAAFNGLLHHKNRIVQQSFNRIIEYITAYDTFFFNKEKEASNELYGDMPDSMNLLSKNSTDNTTFIGMILDEFDDCHSQYEFECILDNKSCGIFNNSQLAVLELLISQREKEIEIAKKQMQIIDIYPYKVALYYYNGKYASEIGNAICDEFPEIEYSLLIDMNRKTAGLRTVRDKDLVEELSIKKLGGGGHPQACGFPFNDDDVIKHLVTRLLQKYVKDELIITNVEDK
jgi:oligoribonuclease NrnB/cAMP/cGMP phosphodiesterase (DHH superfamily)